MKFRPQVQLRFRDEEQFRKVKESAYQAGLSVNEWVLRRIENGTGALGKSASTSRGRSNSGADVAVGVKGGNQDTATGGEVVLSGSRVAGRSEASGKPHQHGAVKKLTAEEFQKLPNSEKLKAQREGRV